MNRTQQHVQNIVQAKHYFF